MTRVELDLILEKFEIMFESLTEEEQLKYIEHTDFLQKIISMNEKNIEKRG